MRRSGPKFSVKSVFHITFIPMNFEIKILKILFKDMGKTNKYLILIGIVIAVFMVFSQSEKANYTSPSFYSNIKHTTSIPQQIFPENLIENIRILSNQNLNEIIKTSFNEEYFKSRETGYRNK